MVGVNNDIILQKISKIIENFPPRGNVQNYIITIIVKES